jgi:hypothetical protein
MKTQTPSTFSNILEIKASYKNYRVTIKEAKAKLIDITIDDHTSCKIIFDDNAINEPIKSFFEAIPCYHLAWIEITIQFLENNEIHKCELYLMLRKKHIFTFVTESSVKDRLLCYFDIKGKAYSAMK